MLRALSRVAQGAKNSCTLLQGKSLGTPAGLYCCGGQSRAQFAFGIVRFQVVPQRLAFLSKRKPQEVDKSIASHAQLFLLRLDDQPEHRGMDLGRWYERLRR